MLKDDYVLIKLGYRNYSYYKDIGYDFTDLDVKNQESIMVKQKDISKGNRLVKIKYICDFCGKDDCETTPYYYYISRQVIEKDACDNIDCRTAKKNLKSSKLYGTTDWAEIARINGYQLGRKKKYTTDDIINMAKLKGHEIISDISEDIIGRDRITLLCQKHNYEFETNITAYMSNDNAKNCRLCKGELLSELMRNSTIDEAIEIGNKKGYTILTDEIRNCDDEINYICSKHSEYGIQNTSLYGLRNFDNNCKLCRSPRGENHYNWKGGLYNDNERDNDSFEYNRWRKSVFDRDNYTCQCCEKHGGDLNAHHIYNYSSYPELRYLTKNGITLCKECHLDSYANGFHKIYGKHDNTFEQLQEFINTRRDELHLPHVDLNNIINDCFSHIDIDE